MHSWYLDTGKEALRWFPTDCLCWQGYEGVHYVVNPGRMVHSSLWQVPQYCIPIHANVINFDWDSLIEEQQFDAVMMDPPWCLATHNPTRGKSSC